MADSRENRELLENLAKLKLFDDVLMSSVFDKQIAQPQLLICSIMGDDAITVVSSKAQHTVTNVYGHEVRLDIVAKDKKGKFYYFEVQRAGKSNRADPRRARFTSAMLDISLLPKGADYPELPDRVTIFITEDDHFGKGLPLYHVENTVRELGNASFGDGAKVIYVNGKYRNTDSPIGALMHDFSCENPDDMINPLLRERVRFLKENEGGKDSMCDIMENLMEKRSRNDRIEFAKQAIAEGELSLESIAKVLHLSLATVQELASSMQSSKAKQA